MVTGEYQHRLKPLSEYIDYSYDDSKSYYEDIVNPTTAEWFDNNFKNDILNEIKSIVNSHEEEVVGSNDPQKFFDPIVDSIAEKAKEYPSIIEDKSNGNIPTEMDQRIRWRKENWTRHLRNKISSIIEKALELYMKDKKYDEKVIAFLNNPTIKDIYKINVLDQIKMGFDPLSSME